MPDVICKWEVLLTPFKHPDIFLSLVCFIFYFKTLGLGADYLLEFCNRVLV